MATKKKTTKTGYAPTSSTAILRLPPPDCRNCKAPLTLQQLKTLFPSKVARPKLAGLVAAFNEARKAFGMVRCLRKAHFFSQIMQEVGPKLEFEEDFYYSSESLLATFKNFRTEEGRIWAVKYGYAPQNKKSKVKSDGNKMIKSDFVAIANLAYLGKNGNSKRISDGEGWKYRGKGLIHLTGKDTYQEAQNELDLQFPGSGIDFFDETHILTSRGSLLAGFAYWSMKKLNDKADWLRTAEGVDVITDVVNFDTKSREERKKNFLISSQVFSVSDCKFAVDFSSTCRPPETRLFGN